MTTATHPLTQVLVICGLCIIVATATPAILQPPARPGVVVVRDLSPADGERLPGRPTRIIAEVQAERDLGRVSLRLNDEEVPALVEPRDGRRWRIEYELTPPLPVAGETRPAEQRVEVVARDVYGRQQTQSWRFTIDPTLSVPTFRDLSPPDGGYAPTGGARIGATVQSDVPIQTATLQIGGIFYPITLEPSAAERSAATARVDLRPGRHQAVLTASDSQGDRAVLRWQIIVPDPGELLAFEQTGKAVGGGFRRFWQEKGGLGIFGLPISDELTEAGRTVQYFERARFEYRASQDGLLSEVQLGLVGTDLRRPDPPSLPATAPDARPFAETGHAIAGPIRRFWEEKGGVSLFGLPISGERREGALTVQYFERARFELTATGTVQLGHLGRELYERRHPQPPTR